MPHTMEELRGPDDTIIRCLYELVKGLAETELESAQDAKAKMEAEFPWLSQ